MYIIKTCYIQIGIIVKFLKTEKENPMISGFSFCIRSFFHKRHFLPILALARVGLEPLYIMLIICISIGLPENYLC